MCVYIYIYIYMRITTYMNTIDDNPRQLYLAGVSRLCFATLKNLQVYLHLVFLLFPLAMRGEQFAAEVEPLLQSYSRFPSANLAINQLVFLQQPSTVEHGLFDFKLCIVYCQFLCDRSAQSQCHEWDTSYPASLASLSYLTTLAGNAFDAERAKSPCRGTSREGALALMTLTEH